MRYLLTLLIILWSLCVNAQGVSLFGASRPQDTSKTKGQIVAPVLASSDTDKVIGVTASGQFVLRTDNSGGGGGSTDSAVFATKAFVGNNYTPLSRTLTINGITYDLSANRTWTIPVLDTSLILVWSDTLAYLATKSDVAAKLNISDTSAMLTPYLRKIDTASLSARIDLRVKYSDTASMLDPYLLAIDTTGKWLYNIANGFGLSKSGGTQYPTLAIDTSVIATPHDLTSYVPYTGAISNVNIGNYHITATALIADTLEPRTSAGLHLHNASHQDILIAGAGGGQNLTIYAPTNFDLLKNLSEEDTVLTTSSSGTIKKKGLTPYLKKADSTLYNPKYRHDTLTTNVYTALGGKQDALGYTPVDIADSGVVYVTEYTKDTLVTSVYDSLGVHRTAIDAKVPLTRNINTTSPLSGGGDLSADRTISIADAAADGTTKGAATFAANDFNATLGVLSLDYTNGQAASGSNKGFLTSADWTTFNTKVGGSGTANYISKFTASGTIGNSTIRDDGSNIGLGGAPNASYKVYNYGSSFTNGITYLLGGGSGGIRSTNAIYVDAFNAGGADIYLRFGNNIDRQLLLSRSLSTISAPFNPHGGFGVRGHIVTSGYTDNNIFLGTTSTYSEIRGYNPTTASYTPIYVNPYLMVGTTTPDGSGREIQNTGQIGSTDTIFTATVMREAGITSSMLKTTSNGTHAAAVAGTDYLTRSTDTIIYAVAISDMTTALTTGTSKGYFRMPHAATLVKVKASVITASSSGTPTFDINEGGTSVLGTKLTIDANETTSETAASAATITDSALANDGIITFDIDTAGTGTLAAIIYLYVIKT